MWCQGGGSRRKPPAWGEGAAAERQPGWPALAPHWNEEISEAVGTAPCEQQPGARCGCIIQLCGFKEQGVIFVILVWFARGLTGRLVCWLCTLGHVFNTWQCFSLFFFFLPLTLKLMTFFVSFPQIIIFKSNTGLVTGSFLLLSIFGYVLNSVEICLDFACVKVIEWALTALPLSLLSHCVDFINVAFSLCQESIIFVKSNYCHAWACAQFLCLRRCAWEIAFEKMFQVF